MISYVRKNKFLLLTFLILIVAALLRFYDYNDRIAFGPDQIASALQAKYALDTKQLPLLGPFSSAGAFQTGGEWYWIVMLGWILVPFSSVAPWIFITLLSLVFIVILMYFAKLLINDKFALVVGFFAAISPTQITQSLNLTNQTPMALFSVLGLLCSYMLLKTNKTIYSFLMGLSIGFAASVHLQGIAMLSFAIPTFIFGKIFQLKKIIVFGIGGLLPWIPVIVKDSENNFSTTRNMINYYLFNSNPVPFEVLGRRWLTFISDFIPRSWGEILGGNIYIGYLVITLCTIFFFYLLKNNKLKKEWGILFVSLGISLIFLRYTRTPLFLSYLVFINPLIFLLTAFAVYRTYIFNKVLGLSLLTLITVSTLIRSEEEVKSALTFKAPINSLKNELVGKYPNNKFEIYDYKFSTPGISYPLAYYLEQENKLHEGGIKVGVGYPTKSALFKFDKKILNSKEGPELYILKDLSNWDGVSPKRFFDVTQNWYK